jgi:DNA-binding PucR family transcriptional regulator
MAAGCVLRTIGRGVTVALDPAVVALREALEERLDDLTDEATDVILAEVPAYRDADRRLRDDVHEHIAAHLRASLETFGTGRDVTREDLLFVRPHAARRARRISVAEFVHAFYVGERVLWDAALGLAHDDESRRAALMLASHLPRYFEVATTHAAEVYLEAEEQLAATAERVGRDLLEDLLAGRPLESGARLDAARAAGLGERSPCIVICARSVGAAGVDEQLLRSAAVALGRATGSVAAPLSIVRHGEIVVIAATGAEQARFVWERLHEVQARLETGGVPLVVGVSTVVPGVGVVGDAYREASAARLAGGHVPGVVALPAMSAFEYLTLRVDPTAGRLIAPAIHEFVEQDLADGGSLVATLREYVACDLNARRAADSLHIHVNTAHYRLAKIAERTDCDLRRVSDLIEILIAARLADAAARDAAS